MKKLILFICLLLFATLSFSQGGVILNEVINSWKRSKHFTSKGEVIMESASLIGTILNKLDERKFEEKVTRLGRDQTTINISDGTQAQVFYDQRGKGIIHKGERFYFSEDFIEKAKEAFFLKEVKLGKLEPYDWRLLEQGFEFKITEDFYEYQLQGKRETLWQIADKNNVQVSNIYLRGYNRGNIRRGKPNKSKYYKATSFKSIYDKRKPLLKAPNMSGILRGYAIVREYSNAGEIARIYIDKRTYADKINYLLTCKWVVDHDGSGAYELREFSGLRRGFYENENFLVCFAYQTECVNTSQKLEIYDNDTGKLMKKVNRKSTDKTNVLTLEINPKEFPSGLYLINLNIINNRTGKTILNKLERFEIVKQN